MKTHRISRYRVMSLSVVILVLWACPCVPAQQSGKSPVKVFILAGQSNMQGKGVISGGAGTLEDLLKNDAQGTYSYLGSANGQWAVRDDVWIVYERSATSTRSGGLTVGYGSNDSQVGPELGFGHVMGDALQNQVLLIKTCWGGKSLAVDFRPPSSGGAVGFYYTEMLRLVDQALANLGTYFPDYDGRGYELAGIFWHQGWNDRVNQGFNDEYEVNLANFIRDVRRDLAVPALPFVIATTGMSGWEETHPRALSLMEAQLAVAQHPEFQGTVASVDTRPFYRPASESPSGQAYHWNSNAITYLDIGLASGEAMKELLDRMSPSPSDGATVPVGDVLLSWTNLDTTVADDPVFVDVWFGTEPNALSPDYDYTQVVSAGEDANTVTVSAPLAGPYYWQVDSYVDGDPNGEPIQGNVYTFYGSNDLPPTVDAGEDRETKSGQPIQLDATVVDDGVSALTYAWRVDPTEGVVFSATDVEDPMVTITRNSRVPITYALTLAVNDELYRTPVEDTMKIIVRP
jgi:alpha-galactosidase